jgi:mRNA interferase YafQ
MYLVKRTAEFKKSYLKIQKSGTFKEQAKNKLFKAITILAHGEKLPTEYKDHPLHGELSLYREFHVKGDLLVIYQIRKSELVLVLVNIGSHSQFNF